MRQIGAKDVGVRGQEQLARRCSGKEHYLTELTMASASACQTICCEEGGAVTIAGNLQTQALGYFTEEPLVLCLSHQEPTNLMNDLGPPIVYYFPHDFNFIQNKSGGFFSRKTELKC